MAGKRVRCVLYCKNCCKTQMAELTILAKWTFREAAEKLKIFARDRVKSGVLAHTCQDPDFEVRSIDPV